MSVSVPLSSYENRLLASLLSRATWPLDREVFEALMQKVISVPIELGVFNDRRQILLVQRPGGDTEFAPGGWHTPGTVIRWTDSVASALSRLLDGEVKSAVSNPVQVDTLECPVGEGHPRHAIALLFTCSLEGTYEGPGQFFDEHDLPPNTLPHHRRLVIPTLYDREFYA